MLRCRREALDKAYLTFGFGACPAWTGATQVITGKQIGSATQRHCAYDVAYVAERLDNHEARAIRLHQATPSQCVHNLALSYPLL